MYHSDFYTHTSLLHDKRVRLVIVVFFTLLWLLGFRFIGNAQGWSPVYNFQRLPSSGFSYQNPFSSSYNASYNVFYNPPRGNNFLRTSFPVSNNFQGLADFRYSVPFGPSSFVPFSFQPLSERLFSSPQSNLNFQSYQPLFRAGEGYSGFSPPPVFPYPITPSPPFSNMPLSYGRTNQNQFSSSQRGLPQPENYTEYPIPYDVPESRKRVIKKALDWIFENPASLQNKMSVEVGEEIMLFYQLYRRAGAQDAKELCRNYIAARISEVVNTGRLGNPTWGEITILLPMCEIMVNLGLSLFDYRFFIRQKLLSNPDTFTPTYAIWNSSILERLGFYPDVPLTHLVQTGAILTEYRTGQLMDMMQVPDGDKDMIMQRFYIITHEIFPLTSFGDSPMALLEPLENSFLQDFIAEALVYFLENPDLDLLSELVISAHMIGLEDKTLLDTAYQFIMDQQETDGSFGDIPRLIEMGRSSAARHGVFVAVWALIQP